MLRRSLARICAASALPGEGPPQYSHPKYNPADADAQQEQSPQQPPKKKEPLTTEELNKLKTQSDFTDEEQFKEYLVKELLSRDKEVYNLKRINELGFMRVEREQHRTIKNQEDRGLYYEQNANFETFNTVTNTSHQRRIVFNHAWDRRQWRRARSVIAVNFAVWMWMYLYWAYQLNTELEYMPSAIFKYVQPQLIRRTILESREERDSFATQQDDQLRKEEDQLRDEVHRWKKVQKEKDAAADAAAAAAATKEKKV